MGSSRRPPGGRPAPRRVAASRPPGGRHPLGVECLDDRALPSAPALLLSTAGDFHGAGTPGLSAWLDREIVRFGDPNLALEPGATNGTFSSVVDLGRFTDNDLNLTAVHRVSRAVTVGSGAGTVALLPGDLIVASDNDGTFASQNTLAVTRDEVFVFRPAAADHSSGTFLMLLDDFGSITGADELTGLTLTETPTTVGDVTLPAGTFLFSRKGGSDEENDVMVFTPTGVGTGRTAGSVALFIEGTDLNYSSKVYGLDLVQATTTVGGRTLAAGTLLMSHEGDDGSVGTNSIPVTRTDVFALSVLKTTLGSGTAVATASVVFEGDDVGLESGSVKIDGLALAAGAANTPPSAAGDAYTTAEDMPLMVAAAAGMLANDSDPDGDALVASLAAAPAHGTVVVGPDGSFTYTPAANYAGPDAFTYAASDGRGGTVTGTVTLTVTPQNDSPVAADDHYTATGGLLLAVPVPGVLANDTDAEGMGLTAQVVNGPSSGTLLLNANGSFTYLPNLFFLGTDSFTYRAWDGVSWSAPATVTINVALLNQGPSASNDAHSTAEDRPRVVAAPGVLGNDTDADGDTLSAVLVSGPSSGTLALNPDGSFAYTPAPDFHGTDSFTYRASDGSLVSATARVTITVTAVNDPPALDPVADSTVDEDSGPFTVPITGLSAGGGESQALTVTATSSHHALFPDPVVTYASPDASGTLTLTSVPNAAGTAVITVTVSDGSAATTRTFRVTVRAVNDGPTITPVADPTIAEDNSTGPIPFTVSDVETSAGALTVTATSSNPALLPDANIELSGGPGTGGWTVRVAPAADASGTAVITLAVSDGTTTTTTSITLTVTPVNDPPVAADDEFSTRRNRELVVAGPGVLGNDRDADGDALTAVLVAGPAHGTLALNPDGSLTYTPRPGYVGIDTFRYRAADGSATSGAARVTVYVRPPNDKPVTADDAFAVDEDGVLTVPGPGVLGNDFDPDGGSLSALLLSDPENGTLVLNPDGSFSYTPARDFYGTDAFTYKADDGTDRSPATHVVITVRPLNDPPSAGDDGLVTLQNVPTVVDVAQLLANDTDPDGDQLVLAGVTPGAHGTVTVVGDTVVYAPWPGYHGEDTFTYTVSDGRGGTATATVAVTVTVAPVNASPTAVGEEYTTAGMLTVGAGGLLANDADTDGNALSVELVAGPSRGTLTLTPDGAFSYTPDPGFVGLDGFTYRVTDGRGGADVANVVISVQPPATPLPPTPPPLTPPVVPAPPEPSRPEPAPAVPPPAVPSPSAPPRTVPPSPPSPPQGLPAVSESPPPAQTDPPAAGAPVADGRPGPVATAPAVRSAPPTGGLPATPIHPTASDQDGRRVSSPVVAVVPDADARTTDQGWVIPLEMWAAPGFSAGPPPAVEATPTPTRPEPSTAPLPPAPVVMLPEPPPSPSAPPMSPAVSVAPPAPAAAPNVPPSDPAAASKVVNDSLDQLQREVRRDGQVTVVADVAVSLGVVATAGYILLSPRTAYWVLSAVLARRTVWSQLDPIDVVYAWERGRGEVSDDESLETMVEK